ncbi:MAG: histidine kinase [Bacteroidales bacterium]|nr:histidine kinase [Bacteroidales bacterium]MCD8394756.1 histidine kinase [Bacteroidales bacterium]
MSTFVFHIDTEAVRKRKIWFYTGAIVLYYLWFQAFYNMVACGKVYPYRSTGEALLGIGLNFFSILVLFLLNTTIVFRLTTALRLLWVKIITDVACSVAATVAFNIIFLVVQRQTWDPQGTLDWAGTLLGDMMILMLNEAAYFLLHWRHARAREEHMRLLATQRQYDLLKMQVNPHFLFNSLNLLYSLSNLDLVRSQKFMLSLSEMYRNILERRDLVKVSVADELRYTRAYFEVLEMRFPECFTVEITGARQAQAADLYIIPCCLQLLVENITKHNAMRPEQHMTITIDISDSGLVVTNPLQPKINQRPGDNAGVGLRYIADVYRNHGLFFTSEKTTDTFVATIPYL